MRYFSHRKVSDDYEEKMPDNKIIIRMELGQLIGLFILSSNQVPSVLDYISNHACQICQFIGKCFLTVIQHIQVPQAQRASRNQPHMSVWMEINISKLQK